MNTNGKFEYTDVQDNPECQEANEEAHQFVEHCGAEIWKNVAGPMLRSLAEAMGMDMDEKHGGLDGMTVSETIEHFKTSPIMRVAFYAGLSNGYTNALMIDKQKRIRMAKIRESN
jgi:hypothetical protein